MVRLSLLLAAAVLGLAACGGGGEKENAATGAPQQTFAVAETDFALSPATLTIDQAGTYAFRATNNGGVEHSLEIEGNGTEAKLDANLPPGHSAVLVLDLEPGTYAMYCPVGNHRALGMKGSIGVGTTAPTTSTDTGSGSGYGG